MREDNSTGGAEFSSRPPNILFIHAESMDGRKMGCMGHPAMQRATPNLDALAERGVLFENAYTNCPVCNPSRASMFSGKYPHHYDCWNNHEGLAEDVPTFRDTLQRGGYNTTAIGPLDYRWGKHSIRDRIGSWTRSANIRRPISRTPMPQIVEGDDIYAGDWRRTWNAIDWLRDAAEDARPFMLYLTTGLVHPAFTAARRHLQLIDDEKIQIPPDLGPLSETPHPVIQYMRITENCDNRFTDDLVGEIRHIYFAMIAALDEMIGRLLDAVDDLDLWESTYIIFSSDHGEMAGEHNKILKRSMYEPSVHEPLIIAGPDAESGAIVDTPVSLIDIYPTLMDMARMDYADYCNDRRYPQQLDGESLMPQLRGNAKRARDWAFSEYNGDRCCTGAYMLRRGPWKYIHYVGYPPQLFNLDDDPWEVNNRAEENANMAAELEKLLRDNFDIDEIDAAAKRYDRAAFRRWRQQAKADGVYERTMAQVYSGYDNLCIEDVMPWDEDDEAQIENWLQRGQ